MRDRDRRLTWTAFAILAMFEEGPVKKITMYLSISTQLQFLSNFENFTLTRAEITARVEQKPNILKLPRISGIFKTVL